MMNKQAFLQMMMNNSEVAKNPMAKTVIDLYGRGDTQGLQQMATNMCKEQGTTPEEVAKRIGM